MIPQGGVTDRCELKDEDPQNIQCVVEWLYTKEYNLPAPDAATTDNLQLAIIPPTTDDDQDQHHEQNVDEEQEEQSSTQGDNNEQTLIAQLDLYTCADRLSIESLCKEAAKNFIALAIPASLEMPYFNRLLQSVCENTAPADRHLRTDFFDRCLRNPNLSLEAVNMIEEHEPLAASLARDLLVCSIDHDELSIAHDLTSARLKHVAARAEAYQKAFVNLKHCLSSGRMYCVSCKQPVAQKNGAIRVESDSYYTGAEDAPVGKFYIECGMCKFKDMLN